MKRLNVFALLAIGTMVAQRPLYADITNTAFLTFKDVSGNSYGPISSAVTIQTPPIFGGPLACAGDLNAPFICTLTASNNPVSFGVTGNLPAGLTLDPSTGKITGTPSQNGTFNLTATATNAAGPATTPLQLVVRGAANVTLTKKSNVSTARPGDTITFTLEYQNIGSGDASGVVVTDDIPVGSTLVPGSVTGGGTLSGNTLLWNVGTVPAGSAKSSVTFQVKAN